jgi:hypothetical protein
MKHKKAKQKLFLFESLIISLFVFIFTANADSQTYCDFIKKVQAYQAFYDSARHQRAFNDDSYNPFELDTTLFNIKKYMKFYDKLMIRPGYECMVYYISAGLNGEPTIYVKEKNFDIDKYIEQKVNDEKITNNELVKEEKDYLLYEFVHEPQRRAFNNIVPDNTEEGYLQYLFFNKMGEQFGLYSHSREDQKSVICSDYEMMKIINDYKNGNNKLLFGYDDSSHRDFQAFTLKIINKENLFKVDSYITVKMLPDKCFISWYELETHFGIFKRSYMINRQAPYQIEKVVDDKLADIIMNFDY